MTIHFLTFANTKLQNTRKRIINEARESGFFDEIYEFSEKDLPEDLNSYCRQNPKGYGFYIWKPYLVDRMINTIKENDIIVWCDAGSSVYKSGKQRFDEYIKMVNESPYANVSFEGWSEHYETTYGKRQAFTVLGAEDFLKLEGGGLGLMAGIFILRNTEYTRKIVRLWKDTCFNHRYLIDDSPEPHNNEMNPNNRQDQPLWSIIRRKYGSVIIPHPIKNYKRPIGTDWFSEVDEEHIDPYGSTRWAKNKHNKKYPLIASRYRF